MENQNPQQKTQNQPGTGQQNPTRNDPNQGDQRGQAGQQYDTKGQTGKGRQDQRPEQPDLTDGMRDEQGDNEGGTPRNPGRPGDPSEDKRGTGTRTGGSPQGGNKA